MYCSRPTTTTVLMSIICDCVTEPRILFCGWCLSDSDTFICCLNALLNGQARFYDTTLAHTSLTALYEQGYQYLVFLWDYSACWRYIRYNIVLLMWCVFQPTVTWCEFVATSSEFYNTCSNVIFLLVGIAGVRRVIRDRLPWPFLGAHASLILVGLGSTVFHSTQTLLGQIVDGELFSSFLFCTSVCLLSDFWIRSIPQNFQWAWWPFSICGA